MGDVIFNTTQTEPEEKPAPPDVTIESEIAEKVVVDFGSVKKPGDKSIFACPDCGGSGKENRYSCHIGHFYSERFGSKTI